MILPTASYLDQQQRWPSSGRHILAHFDEETIVVYQAYRPSIGQYAVRHGSFGGEFSYARMSWIKPNFLWMMHRCDWGRSKNQEVVLAVRLRRTFFDSLLAQAVPSSFCFPYSDQAAWQAAVARSDVRLQWDPDHLPSGRNCARRAIQIGMRGAALEAYGRREIVEIIDLGAFVAAQRELAANWSDGKLHTPVEAVYPISDRDVAARLGCEFDEPHGG